MDWFLTDDFTGDRTKPTEYKKLISPYYRIYASVNSASIS